PLPIYGRAVLLLDSGEVAEVEPLDGLHRVARRARDVEAVALRHLAELSERPDLLGELLAIANDLVRRHRGIEGVLLLLLALDQPVHAVERDAAVVADDPAAAVGVGQSREDVRAAAAADVSGVGVEDGSVVGLPVLGESLHHGRIGLVAVRLQPTPAHAKPAPRPERALRR